MPKYLITGAPHSGTRYMTLLFREFGINVDHERMGPDGISCWAWAVSDPDPPWSPGPRPDLQDWEIVHVWRDPRYCIPALADDVKEATLRFVARQIGAESSREPLLRAVLTWLHWNREAAALKPDHTVNVEIAPHYFADYFGRQPRSLPSTTVNSRAGGARQPMSYDVMAREVGTELTREVARLAVQRGYEAWVAA